MATATDNITFSQVRCSLCGKVFVEVAAENKGFVRGQCRGCKTLHTVFCRAGDAPRIVESQNKALQNQSKF